MSVELRLINMIEFTVNHLKVKYRFSNIKPMLNNVKNSDNEVVKKVVKSDRFKSLYSNEVKKTERVEQLSLF